VAERAQVAAPPLAKVDDYVKRGEPFPDNVTGFIDDDGDFAVRRPDDSWACYDGEQGDDEDEPRYGVKTIAGAQNWAIWPVRVTKIREPEQTCPAHGAHPHNGPGVVNGGGVCLDCPICRPPAEPQPESDGLRCPTCDSPQPSMHPAVSGGGEVISFCSNGFHAPEGRPGFMEQNRMLITEVERLRRLLKTQAENFSAATDKLIAERDDYATLMKLTAAERDEARAEVERLKGALAAEEEGRRQDWVDRLTPPDPLVLTLPQVPEGAVLVGPRGMEYTSYEIAEERGGGRRWECGSWHGGLGSVLDVEGSVRVELAPREPRTWPKLDEENADLPSVVSVERHGVWRRLALPDDRLYEQSDGFGAIKVTLRLPLSGLQLLGDVTELLDEPGGQP
jgi:hypothetical protein